MFIVNSFINRNLSDEKLQYTMMDNDLTYDECPAVFSTMKKAMEYVNEMEGRYPEVYCMVFKERLDHPYDIPVVYNGKFTQR